MGEADRGLLYAVAMMAAGWDGCPDFAEATADNTTGRRAEGRRLGGDGKETICSDGLQG